MEKGSPAWPICWSINTLNLYLPISSVAAALVINISSLYHHMTHSYSIHQTGRRLRPSSTENSYCCRSWCHWSTSGTSWSETWMQKREGESSHTVFWCTCMVKIINELCDFTFYMLCLYFVCAELWRRMKDYRKVWRQDVENTAIRKSVFFNRDIKLEFIWKLWLTAPETDNLDDWLHQDISVPCFNFQRHLGKTWSPQHLQDLSDISGI